MRWKNKKFGAQWANSRISSKIFKIVRVYILWVVNIRNK